MSLEPLRHGVLIDDDVAVGVITDPDPDPDPDGPPGVFNFSSPANSALIGIL